MHRAECCPGAKGCGTDVSVILHSDDGNRFDEHGYVATGIGAEPVDRKTPHLATVQA